MVSPYWDIEVVLDVASHENPTSGFAKWGGPQTAVSYGYEICTSVCVHDASKAAPGDRSYSCQAAPMRLYKSRYIQVLVHSFDDIFFRYVDTEGFFFFVRRNAVVLLRTRRRSCDGAHS